MLEQGPQPALDNHPGPGREPKRTLYVLRAAHFQQLQLLFGDLRVEDVDRLRVVVQTGRLHDDERRADDARNREDPQEHAIEHHGHVLPVLLHLVWCVRLMSSQNVDVACGVEEENTRRGENMLFSRDRSFAMQSQGI